MLNDYNWLLGRRANSIGNRCSGWPSVLINKICSYFESPKLIFWANFIRKSFFYLKKCEKSDLFDCFLKKFLFFAYFSKQCSYFHSSDLVTLLMPITKNSQIAKNQENIFPSFKIFYSWNICALHGQHFVNFLFKMQ